MKHRINLTQNMPISERQKIIKSRIEKAYQNIEHWQVKATIDTLRSEGLQAKYLSFFKSLLPEKE